MAPSYGSCPVCDLMLFASKTGGHDAASMVSTLWFWLAFGLTVVLLVAAICTGLSKRRRLHLWLGPLTMLSLVVTIVLTEKLMLRYDFPADLKAIHLPCAKAGGLLALPVIITGLLLWRREQWRRWHRGALVVWLVSVLLATSTGLWMFAHGSLRG